MRAWMGILLCLLLLCPAAALAGEGDPLLSVDELLSLEDSYSAFLDELGALAVRRGLLSEDELPAWHDAQLGDFFQNGGYGSILATFMPGALDYVREEDTLLTLRAQLPCGTLELLTVRRYTPQDSSLPGLMLSLSLTDAAGAPIDAVWQLSATSGLFLKWDALEGTYASVGPGAQSDGETVYWSDQTPAQNASSPVLTLDILSAATHEAIGRASLTLTVDGDGYVLGDGALSGT